MMNGPTPSRTFTVNGFILVDKPQGFTSQRCVQYFKRRLGAGRVGHIGTLDPLATGLLPIILGEATRYAFGLERADKIYEAVVAFGGISHTDDAEGEITPMPPVAPSLLTVDHIRQLCQQFTGDIAQRPPLYSAVKINGQPLYKKARRQHEKKVAARDTLNETRGNCPDEMTAPLRRVTIHSLEVVSINATRQEIVLRIHCGSGTYIRSLARDMGETLGSGGYLKALRRVQVAQLQVEQAVTIEAFEHALSEGTWTQHLQPTEALMLDWPIIHINAEQARQLYCGQTVVLGAAFIEAMPALINNHPKRDNRYRLHKDNAFIGIGEILNHGELINGVMAQPDKPLLHARRLLPVNTNL